MCTTKIMVFSDSLKMSGKRNNIVMKRDDMLKLMLEAQVNPPEYISNMSDGGEQMVRLMSHILTIMEDAGMLPPTRPAKLEETCITNITQEFLDEHEFTVNDWDAEGEEPETIK